MLRAIIGVIVAVITWFGVATICNWILRAVQPGYKAAEVSMTFTLAMMMCRLVLGLVSSFCAGFVCAARHRRKSARAKGSRADHGAFVSPSALHALDQVRFGITC